VVGKGSRGSLLASLALLQAMELLGPHVASLGAPLGAPPQGGALRGGVGEGEGRWVRHLPFGAVALAPVKKAQEAFLRGLASGGTPAVPLRTAVAWLLSPPPLLVGTLQSPPWYTRNVKPPPVRSWRHLHLLPF